jgi:hypothetical protein
MHVHVYVYSPRLRIRKPRSKALRVKALREDQGLGSQRKPSIRLFIKDASNVHIRVWGTLVSVLSFAGSRKL